MEDLRIDEIIKKVIKEDEGMEKLIQREHRRELGEQTQRTMVEKIKERLGEDGSEPSERSEKELESGKRSFEEKRYKKFQRK